MTSRSDTGCRPRDGFVHTALIIDSDDTVRSALIPVVRDALDRQLPVFMVVSDHIERVVRAELGTLGDALEWGEPSAFYPRMGFAYEGFRRYLAAQHAAGRRVHVIAEPNVTNDTGPASPVDRVSAYLAYEAMCNEAYAPYGCPVTCLWDSRRHPGLIIDGVRRVHGHELTAAGLTPNGGYRTPQEYLAGITDIPLPSPPAQVDLHLRLVDADGLRPMRTALGAWAQRCGFAQTATADIILAVTEVATNGLVHGAPPVQIRAWRQNGTLIVQADDSRGRELSPLVGYRRPSSTTAEGGRGMWLARQLADTVTVHTLPGRTTSVRLHFPYDVTHRDQG